jgi:hypothetical protein
MQGALRLGKAAARVGSRRDLCMAMSPSRFLFTSQPSNVRPICLQVRYSSTNESPVASPAKEEEGEDDPLNPGETLLYRETQQFTVRMMLGVSGVNFLVRITHAPPFACSFALI